MINGNVKELSSCNFGKIIKMLSNNFPLLFQILYSNVFQRTSFLLTSLVGCLFYRKLFFYIIFTSFSQNATLYREALKARSNISQNQCYLYCTCSIMVPLSQLSLCRTLHTLCRILCRHFTLS